MFTRGARTRDLHAMVLAAVSDANLSDEEKRQIQQAAVKLGLSREELGSIRGKAFHAAAEQVVSDGVVDEAEIARLDDIHGFLQVADHESDHAWRYVLRLRLATEIRAGNLPGNDRDARALLEVPGLVLGANEVVHWVEPGDLLEERVVRRGYAGGSAGVNVRVVRGVSVNVGRHGGQLVSERGIVPVSGGSLVLTSKRIVFRGDRKSFQMPLGKLLEYVADGAMVRVTDGAGKSREVRLRDPSSGMIFDALLDVLTGMTSTG
jgi:hypothetical protein